MAARRSSPQNPFLPLLAEVQKRVEPHLARALAKSEAEARGYGAEVGSMVRSVASLNERGGKRLRPALAVVGALSASADAKPDWAPLLDAGVALELLQSYFLIHDDWMDEDEERRGGPTAHVELARVFRSEALGARAAILAGDHAVSLAQLALSEAKVPPARLVAALRTFAEMQLAAVAGQQLDIIGKTKTPELTYELKTASYTVTGPLLLGANLAGARPPVLAQLRAYGLPAGVAFQLRDDLIGVFGDPKRTGKPRGADLTAGKNTPLVRHGLLLLEGKARQRLVSVLGNRKSPTRTVEAVVTSLEESGAKARVEARIAELRDEALGVLERGPASPRSRALLAGAARALTERDA